MELLRPGRLAPGARIGVVSPAYWMEPAQCDQGAEVLRGLGYELVLGESCSARDRRFAGSPEARAADLMQMFADPAIDAIFCARGGYGCNRVQPLLDYSVVRANPKIFMGYSDLTALLSACTQKAGLITFHGPMLSTFGRRAEPWNLAVLQDVLGGTPDLEIGSAPGCDIRILRPGVGRGPLWGGNATLVAERLGTPGQLDTRGAVLVLEDIDEYLYRFDRLLLQLRESGSLAGLAGLVIGELLSVHDTEPGFGRNTDEIVLEACAGYDFPIISNFPCGHGVFQATLPIGYAVELLAVDLQDGGQPRIRIPGSPVI